MAPSMAPCPTPMSKKVSLAVGARAKKMFTIDIGRKEPEIPVKLTGSGIKLSVNTLRQAAPLEYSTFQKS